MAHVYVRSGAAGTNDGSSKTNARTTLAAALSAGTAGDNFWVASDHAETQASAMTLTSPGTLAAPCTVMCVDFAGSTPPVAADLRTTATITTTGAAALGIDKTAHYYGITFSAGTGAVSSGISLGINAGHAITFTSCKLRKLGTSGDTSAMKIDGYTFISFNNTQLDFGATGDALTVSGGSRFRWSNTAAPVITVFPSTLIYDDHAAGILLHGVDFSAAGFSGKNLLSVNNSTSLCDKYLFNCKVHVSLTVCNTPTPYGTNFLLIQSDSAGTNYRHEQKTRMGAQVVETGTVRTGGATDGLTPISWAITTTADVNRLLPYEAILTSIKNNTTGNNVTVTIYGTWGGGAVPTNADIWPVISYMGSGGSPIATIVSGGPADFLAAGTNWATDGTSVWGGGTTPFKMAVTLSSPQPALRGPIYVTVKAAKASSTFIVDPKIVLT